METTEKRIAHHRKAFESPRGDWIPFRSVIGICKESIDGVAYWKVYCMGFVVATAGAEAERFLAEFKAWREEGEEG